MKNIRLNSIFVFLLISLSMAANSSILGKVTDSVNDQYLMGANIILEGTNLGGASDENGNYHIINVPIGRYTLTAMYMGYKTKKENIRIEGNQEYTIDIRLQPSSIKLEETRVTAEKRKGKITEAPASIEIVSSRDIKREATTNIGSYLKGLKGVDFTSSGINNYSISIRGFNSSFNTRVLTLTDGRVANLPALRVINYSAVPQSMDDIDRMEVILGPATALYGANAHSGVVNIISKPPSQSEGLTMSVSGSKDEREMRKINGRWAKKLSDSFSIKLSGMYLHGYEWPYISENEYKSHLYPWVGNPYRMHDGKDNNPWNNSGTTPDSSYSQITDKWYIIGNGEQMDTGDPDGDGVMGEDWFNGYDDDGDGLIDEDYFIANGIDDNGDCSSDSNGDGCFCCTGDLNVDENIDHANDEWADGYDNDGNGQIDDGREMFTNSSGTNYDPEWSYNIEERDIIIKGGRGVETIHGEPNPWYIEGSTLAYSDLKGDYYYDETQVKYLFDVYIYDFGKDGIPGDPYDDISGNGIFDQGESLFWTGFMDVGLDGMPNTGDYGEGDLIWQPGDCWLDLNNNGIIDQPEQGVGTPDGFAMFANDTTYDDLYPFANGVWDTGEEILGDWGNDGYPGTGDPGEGDGLFIPWDENENDNIFDTGDGQFGYAGDEFYDYGIDGIPNTEDEGESDGIWQSGETFIDGNGDSIYTPPDYMDTFQFVADNNGDGLSDYPDFEVENSKAEFRLDFDPNINYNLTFQSGYSKTKTQQVTGTSRYLADGFEYRYYQLRGRFYNWYSQIYMNQSFSGNTRSYNTGNIVADSSKNYAFQLQRNDDLKSINTKLVWGIDYFKTLPSTYGSILNDGPNGYDNDGDFLTEGFDGIDNDGDCPGDTNLDGCICCRGDVGVDEKTCADGWVDGIMDGIPDESGNKNGRLWQCGEGYDELDEFINPESNEYGIYFQTKTELFGTSRFELITAARLDKHDLLDEGIQFAPKIGLIYKPDEKSSFRLTYGKAFNTPNAITLYTDLYVRKLGILDVYLRGNKDGTPYCRVGQTCSGSDAINTGYPGFYYCDGYYTQDGICVGDSTYNSISPLESDYFIGNDELAPYNERVMGAPYFYALGDGGVPTDMIPLDTSRYLIYIPELNGDGILYTPEESFNIPDVDPIKTEKIQTIEFGYKGFISSRTHLTFDYYVSYYEDFFSPPTFITPSVFLRDWKNGNEIREIDSLSFAGIMPVNTFGANAPYGTAWNGLDDDGDWEIWASSGYDENGQMLGFGWAENDLDGDGNYADPGEWGFVSYYDINDSTNFTLSHPEEVVVIIEGGIDFLTTDSEGNPINPNFFDAVGVDEYHPTVGLNEAEIIAVGLIGENGEQLPGLGLANSPPHLVLSPMNYGDVWMQGMDIGLTQLLPEYNLIIDGNISWYGTTEFYNELTKKNDPINAPKWKWNISIKWDPPSLGELALNYRHVNQFNWNDGIWAGIIGPYDIFDFHYNYILTKNLELSVSALNFMDDRHKELIGGAEMGRQVIMRITSTF